jgi:hypothetical protein
MSREPVLRPPGLERADEFVYIPLETAEVEPSHRGPPCPAATASDDTRHEQASQDPS